MISRVVGWKRPRRAALLVLMAAFVVAAITAATGQALVSDSGTVDVQVPDKTTSKVDKQTAQGAFVSYFGDSDTTFGASGTGLFDPFVRLQGSPTEQGYNTCSQSSCGGDVSEFDTKSGTWTHAILVSKIPQRPCPTVNPSPPPAVNSETCFELFNDINDSNTAKFISLNKVQVFYTDNPRLTGYATFSTSPPAGTTLQYNFNGDILIHDVNQGSGRGDLRYDIPIGTAANQVPLPSNCDYGNPLCNTYFLLYSKWGTTTTTAPDGGTYGSDGGFEEWKVKIYPAVHILKTANPAGPVNAGSNIGFDITVSNTGLADATNLTVTDPLPAGAGNDLNWSLNPAFSGCSITGAVGSQILSCTFATLAAGASIGPIHITSPTTAKDCATVTNTATVASGNDGGGSSMASVDVQCGALLILKNSTKSNSLVKKAGAVFAVTGTASFSVTDNGSKDEDSTVGSVCVSGLAPGTYTVNETSPPTGYGNAGQTNVGLTVSNGTNCTTNLPGTGATATFTDPPLSDIQVRFRDGGSTETKLGAAGITCTNTTGTSDNTPTTGWDNTHTVTGIKVTSSTITVTCTIPIDP
jgi:uncharacterized repeat protein (TIGR01451 family)